MPGPAPARGDPASRAVAFWPVARLPPGDLLIRGAAILLLVNGLIWVTVGLWHAPPLAVNPAPAIIGWWGFGFFATALSAVTRALLRRPIPALWVVATFAMWALLPPTLLAVFFSVVYAYAGPLTPLVVAAPLLAVVAARVLAARGLVTRAVAFLLPALLIAAAATWLLLGPSRHVAWLIATGWYGLLATAALSAATWDRCTARTMRSRTGP